MNYSITQVDFDPLLPDPSDLSYANVLERTARHYTWVSAALGVALAALAFAALAFAALGDRRWLVPLATALIALIASLVKVRRCAVLARRIRLGRAVGVGKRLFRYRERRAKRFW